MADLSLLDSEMIVGLVGLNTSGQVTYPVGSTENGDVKAADIANVSAVFASKALTTTASEMIVGGSVLTNRKMIKLIAASNNIVYGYSNSSQIFPLYKDQVLIESLGSNISIWAKTTSGTGTIYIAEYS